jgi:2-dehydro-3-deoxy-D-gluconate 5-dehydrogenase
MMTPHNPFDFTGKTVLLTGAAGGLGHPVCIAFARAGALVAIFDINEKALATIASEIKSHSGSLAFTAKVDLCSQKEVEDSVRLVCDKFQKIDVLVNLVGGIVRKPSADYPLEDWQRVMDINLKACWLCCQAVGRVMIKQKQGRIINFSSNAGLHGNRGYPAYGPAKAGVIALTRVLAVEWGPNGIATNAIAPGFTKTPFNAEILSDPKMVERILGRLPFGQVLPDDAMVGPTLFLASEAAHWVNGHTLHVDSGFNIT